MQLWTIYSELKVIAIYRHQHGSQQEKDMWIISCIRDFWNLTSHSLRGMYLSFRITYSLHLQVQRGCNAELVTAERSPSSVTVKQWCRPLYSDQSRVKAGLTGLSTTEISVLRKVQTCNVTAYRHAVTLQVTDTIRSCDLNFHPLPHGVAVSCERYALGFPVDYGSPRNIFAASSGFVHLYTLRFKEKEKRAAVVTCHVARPALLRP